MKREVAVRTCFAKRTYRYFAQNTAISSRSGNTSSDAANPEVVRVGLRRPRPGKPILPYHTFGRFRASRKSRVPEILNGATSSA